MNKDFDKLETIAEVVFYWHQCLAKFGEVPSTTLAGYMVGIITNDRFETWYNGYYESPRPNQAGNKDFVEVFDLVCDLEAQGDYEDEINEYSWRRVRELMKSLDKEYPDKSLT